MRQIEGHGETENLLRREELLRQPHMRQGDEATGRKFAMEPLDSTRHQRTAELHRQVTQTRRQQRLVGSILQVDRWPSADVAFCALGHLQSLGSSGASRMRGQRSGYAKVAAQA